MPTLFSFRLPCFGSKLNFKSANPCRSVAFFSCAGKKQLFCKFWSCVGFLRQAQDRCAICNCAVLASAVSIILSFCSKITAVSFFRLVANGFRLGDGGEIKAQMFNRIPNAQFSTTAPQLPNRCLGAEVIHCQWIELSQVQPLFHPLLSREQSLFVSQISPAKLTGFENYPPQKPLLIRFLCRAPVLSSMGQFRICLSNRLSAL